MHMNLGCSFVSDSVNYLNRFTLVLTYSTRGNIEVNLKVLFEKLLGINFNQKLTSIYISTVNKRRKRHVTT